MADTDEIITSDFTGLQEMIDSLDLLNEKVNSAVRAGLEKGGDIIVEEQKRLAEEINSRLPECIGKSGVYTTSKGVLGFRAGIMGLDYYDDDDDDYVETMRVAMTFEFGRPGNSSTFRRNPKRWWHFYRKRKDGGKTFVLMVQKKGTIQPHAYVRRGFHNTADHASQVIIDEVKKSIESVENT